MPTCSSRRWKRSCTKTRHRSSQDQPKNAGNAASALRFKASVDEWCWLRQNLHSDNPGCPPPQRRRRGKTNMHVARISWCLVSLLLCRPAMRGQSAAGSTEQRTRPVVQNVSGCDEAPREDAGASLCAPPSSEETLATAAEPLVPADIALTLPTGTPLRIALDQRVRIDHSGEVVHC